MSDTEASLPLPPSVRWKTFTAAGRYYYDEQRRITREIGAPISTPGDVRLMLGNYDAMEALDVLCAGRTPAEVRSAASLTVRCDDCRGAAIAWVFWVEGRPLFMGDQGGNGNAWVSLLDVPELAKPFRCRRVRWSFTWPANDVPGPGAAPEQLRLRHAG